MKLVMKRPTPRSRAAFILIGLAALEGVAALGGAAAQAASTVFVALPPCRVADTRVAGGPIASNTNRVFKVVGLATDFTTQGGSATGCGVPGFSGVVPQVQAIALNFAAANHAGAGFLTAFAGDTSRPLASTLNFTAGTTIANGVIVPVRQTAPEGNDLKVFVNVTSDVFMDVTGYFTDITLVDGSGSGIDADMVDGFHASDLGDITGVTAGTGLTGGGTSGNVTLNLDASAVGDITGVAAGTGLTGGGTSGDVTVNLDLAASNTWTGNTTVDPASGFALSTGTGDDINLGGNVKKGGTPFLHNTGTKNLGVGLNALAHVTTGSANSASGASALQFNTDGSRNTANGYSALRVNTTGYGNTAVGNYALRSNNTGYRNTAIGSTTLRYNSTGNLNTATGYFALRGNTIGSRNTAIGNFALSANSSGYRNTASGSYALSLNTTGARNTGLGYRAGYYLTTGNDNIDIGNPGVADESATIRLGTSGTQTSTFIAGIRGVSVSGGLPVVINSSGQLGTTAAASGTVTSVGTDSTLTGGLITTSGTLGVNLAASNTWTGNTTFDPASGLAFSTGSGDDIDMGGNVKKGGLLFLHNNGVNNLGVGLSALASNTTGFGNTASGTSALVSNTTGDSNTASGAYALFFNTTGFRNTASGKFALYSNTTGSRNIADGEAALFSNTTGFYNTASGNRALFSNTTGSRNTVDGMYALFSSTIGDNNTASGAYALRDNTTGSSNTVVGYRAGANLTTGNNNIDIGNQGVAGESATIRLGTPATHTRAFIAGIRGVTTDAADAIPVVVSSTGQLGTVSSSRRYKEEIRDMGTVTDRLLKLRPVTFRYKKEVQQGVRPVEFGLIAEEVAEVFPELVVYGKDGRPETVKYHVLAPLLLNELQRQKIQVEEREGRLEQQLTEERRESAGERARLEGELSAQRAQLAAMLDRLVAIEGGRGPGEPVVTKAPRR